MLAQTYFHDVAFRVRDLLGCEAVLLVLDCPEADLCHPLLEWLSASGVSRYFGAPELQSLLKDERVRELREIAYLSGQMRAINGCRLSMGAWPARSVAVAPVERPAGLLGYFVLADARPDSFTEGDARLLNDYLKTILIEFEGEVRKLSSGARNSDRARIVEGPVILPKVEENEVLRLADGLKNDLISMVSHELRAPLTAIKGYTGLLQAYSVEDGRGENGRDFTITPARQQQYLDIIMDQTRHLEIVMGDLLDVSRIQAGKLALQITEVDVASICQQVIRLAQQRIDQQHLESHRLFCEVSPDLPAVLADAHRLQQILHNLLDNAIKYSPNGGLIELRAAIEYQSINTPPLPGRVQDAPFAQITIRDRGIGIDMRQSARLFRPFSRLDHPETSQVQGVGLGLFITQKLVEAMKGTIELTSQENKGTTVTISFPLSQGEMSRLPLLSKV